MKVQIVISQGKIICTAFASGKIHDFKLFKFSRLSIAKNTLLIADTGYFGIEQIHTKTLIPKKSSKLRKLTSEDKFYNCVVSKLRISVEHTFRFLKRFNLFAERYRARRKTFAKRFNLICAMFNFNF